MVQDKIRLRFFKKGRMVFISHLDTIRTLTAALSRAGIPVYYSEGFNPHPKMVFALALPLGCESECEYLDIRLRTPMDENELLSKLNEQFPPDMQFTQCVSRDGCDDFLSIRSAEYTIRICEKVDISDVESALCGELTVKKRSKKGMIDADLQPMILRQSVDMDENGDIVINICLKSEQNACANPVHILTALSEKLGREINDWYISREKIYVENEKEFH